MLLSKTFKNPEKLWLITTFHDFSRQVQTKLIFQAFLDFRYHETSFLLPNLANNFSRSWNFISEKKG